MTSNLNFKIFLTFYFLVNMKLVSNVVQLTATTLIWLVTVNGLFCTIIATSGFQASTVADFTIFCLKITTSQILKKKVAIA